MTNQSLFAISQIFALCFCLVSIVTIAETADIKLPEIQIQNVLSEKLTHSSKNKRVEDSNSDTGTLLF